MEAYSSDDAREDWMPSCEKLAFFYVWSDVTSKHMLLRDGAALIDPVRGVLARVVVVEVPVVKWLINVRPA